MPNNIMASTTANDADYKTALMACMALAGMREANGEKTRAPPELFYHGKRIISLDDVTAGLHITKKTMRKYRDEGKIEIYESRTCGAAFVTQDAFNDFIDSHFISSRHPEYPKLKKRHGKDGNNAAS